VQISVDAAPDRTRLSELPNLTPNQKRMASALDDVCSRVLGLDDGGDTGGEASNASKPAVASQKAGPLATAAEQSDLANKCRGLLFNNTAANQVEALDELNGEDFAVARTQTLLFANFQQAGILDRLMALRGGARGLSLAGLNIMIDGKAVPLATLQKMAADLLGGGASSDADEAGGLLSDKWGMWMRGNYSSGKKDASEASPSFDADQFAIIGGLDYRLSEKAVAGLSMAYGNSSVEFNPRSEGALDTTSWALSAYGSMYAAQNFYLDGIFNVADSDYAADRNITYVDGQGLVNADARGDTSGMTLSGGLSLGYDFLVKGLTISPNLGAFYIDATIDSFTERGAGGLNLIYDEQNFKSLTSNLGLRVTYAWNLPWGVLLPHVRVDYVREFEDDVDVFGIRFAADPNAGATPPILVETDNPDTSYWRMAAGFSAQFPLGFSGYVEYQRLESFQFISFQDISVGLRMQKSF
jgi:outer membrane autotransporter protein